MSALARGASGDPDCDPHRLHFVAVDLHLHQRVLTQLRPRREVPKSHQIGANHFQGELPTVFY